MAVKTYGVSVREKLKNYQTDTMRLLSPRFLASYAIG